MNNPSEKFDLSTVDNVIFDLGGVIIDIDFNLTIQAFANLSGYSFYQVAQKFEEFEVYDVYERGKLNDDGFRDFMRKHFQLQQSNEKIDAAWNSLLLTLPKERVDLVLEIGKTKRTFLLSNTSNIHIVETNQILERETGLPRLKDMVEKAYFSYEIEMRKPDLEIYEFVLQDANLDPSRTLFIDDNLDNVKGSLEAGIQTLHLVAPNDIRKALVL